MTSDPEWRRLHTEMRVLQPKCYRYVSLLFPNRLNHLRDDTLFHSGKGFPCFSFAIKTFEDITRDIANSTSTEHSVSLVVKTDALAYDLLNQISCPVAFFSCPLFPSEQQYPSTKGKAYVIVETLMKLEITSASSLTRCQLFSCLNSKFQK